MGFSELSSELFGIDPKQTQQRAEQASSVQSSMAEGFKEFIERERNLIDRLMASEETDKRRNAEKNLDDAVGSSTEEVKTKTTTRSSSDDRSDGTGTTAKKSDAKKASGPMSTADRLAAMAQSRSSKSASKDAPSLG